MDIDDVITVVNNDVAASFCLSKGGWEGWLQCELWRHLTITKNEVAEREFPYPIGGAARCDLVTSRNGTALWVEIKAFGIFREGDETLFLDSIGVDVQKLSRKPAGALGLSIVVVPAAIGEAFHVALATRRWVNFERRDCDYASVYSLQVA